MKLNKIHHVAVICSHFERSLDFYTSVLGLRLLSKHYREDRQSYKADLALGDEYVVELFSFPDPSQRPSYPEAAGLRHLAFEVDDIEDAQRELDARGVGHEPLRTDPYTGKRFLFMHDPDNLPIELYER